MSTKHILHALNKYMFTGNAYHNIRNNNIRHNKINETTKHPRKQDQHQHQHQQQHQQQQQQQHQHQHQQPLQQEKKESIKQDTSFVTPAYNDKFFWCFFIIYKGIDRYNDINNKHFKTETSFKMNIAEELKNNEEILKAHKIKRCIVESELINDKSISITTLYAMCLVYKINIIYTFNRSYLKLFGNNNMNDNMPDKIHLLKKDENGRIGIVQNISEDDVNNITDNFYQQINYKKPILAISAYKIPQIQDIATKLNISLVSELGKKKTKLILYQEILSKV